MKERLKDSRLRLLGPVGLFVFVGVFIQLDWYFGMPLENILLNDTIALTAGLLSWQVARWVVLRIQQSYPGLVNTRRRLIALLAVLPLLISFAWFTRHAAHLLIDDKYLYYSNSIELSRTIGIQLFYHFIYFAVYEVGYIVRQWHQEAVKTKTFEKISLQSQLASLQHQVNPHFLFNSLNSLSSLIAESPSRADAFLDELTTVFRYLLQASERSWVPLGDEKAFILSYGHLLRTRYQNGFVLDVEIAPAYENLLLPPLTLQLLVENAVRYNSILPQQPLTIRIHSTQDDRLLIANTLERKPLRVNSATGSGLTNLAKRYELLGTGAIIIEERPGWFVVSIPLVEEGQSQEKR